MAHAWSETWRSQHKLGKQNLRAKLNYFLLTIVLLSLSACAQSSDCFDRDVFCAALVTDTLGLNDHGLTEDAWQGLEQSMADGVVDEIAHIESVDTRDYEKNISYFAQQGFDVILTSGVGMQDETLRSADLYPDSVFIGINQPQEESRPNLIPVTFAEDQMGFIAGTIAASLTETNTVGAACETSGIDSMWRYCEGFRAGALFANPDIKVIVIYREDGDREKLFVDEAWGATTAQKLIQHGVDVLFAVGGVTGQAALRTASDAGLYVIGAERDQAAVLAPESGQGVVTSIYGSASFEVQTLMRLLKDGSEYGPRIGQFGYVPLGQEFPESRSDELNLLIKAVFNGDIMTNVTSERP